MMTPMTLGQRRLVGWVIGVGAVLLVAGYLTADQWLKLVGGLL